MKQRWVAWLIGGVVVVGVAIVAGLAWLDRYMQTGLRERAIVVLEQRLESKVELAGLQVSLGREISVKGSGFVVRHRGRTDVPPLVSVESFEAVVPWSGYFEKPPRLSMVTMHGLQLTTPPRDKKPGRDKEVGGCQDRATAGAHESDAIAPAPFLIDRLTSRSGRLTLLPSKPGKRPRVFDIAHVSLTRFALDRAAEFEATVTNPVPRGDVAVTGAFGPWNASHPSETAVRGRYTFSDADMGTVKGVAGRLQSKGEFEGLLQQILVKGEAEVPDFGLTTSANRLPLKTTFDACVDGTDGDTYLDRVDAKLASTPIAATGKVEGKVGVDGRFIVLDVKVADGAVEDLLRLAVDDAEPLMTGKIDVESAFELPPGKDDVVERLNLKGRFSLRNTRFTAGKVQGKINELSRRGRGDMDQEKPSAVRATFGGRFALDNAALQLSSFRFAVPGAIVQLHGQYGLRSQRIDFNGRVRTDARVSQMTTGVKSFFLKAIDPLFARDGAGAIFPITIGGTRAEPSMKVDVRKALLRKD